MANTYQGSVSTKYLNLTGLESFWAKVKEYVDNQDQAVNNRLTDLYNAVLGDGGNVEVEGSSLGERLVSLEQGLDAIQSSYVADINAENFNTNTETQYVTISVTDDTDTETNGKQTKITIDDSALTEKISDIEDNYAKTEDLPQTLPNPSKLKITNASGTVIEYDGSSVVEVDSISHSNTSNDSDKLDGYDSTHFATADSITGLGERLTAVEGYVQDVDAENSNTGTQYVTISVTNDTNTGSNGKQTKITINDSALIEKFSSIDAISHVNSIDGQSGVITVDKNNQDTWAVNFEVGDDKKLTGEVVAPDHLGIEDIQTSVGAGVDGYLTLTENEINGVSTITLGGTLDETIDTLKRYVQDVDAENSNTGTKYVTISITDDTNTNVQGKQTKITIDDSSLTEKLASIDAISHVNSIDGQSGVITVDKDAADPWSVNFEVGTDKELTGTVVPGTLVSTISTTDGTYVKLTPDTATSGNVTVAVNDSSLTTKINSIDDYTINSQKISTNPVLTGSDITLGIDLDGNGENNWNTGKTLTDSIQALRELIAGLGHVMEIKGILNTLPDTTEGYENGDVVIIAANDNEGDNNGSKQEYLCYNSKWYLLGYTNAVEQTLNNHTHNVPKTSTTAVSVSTASHSHTATENGAHTHTVTGTVSSSLSNSSAAKSTATAVSVSKSTHSHTAAENGAHTHTVTGNVTSSLSDGNATEAGAHTHTVTGTVSSSLSGGSAAKSTATAVSVSKSTHTHTVAENGTHNHTVNNATIGISYSNGTLTLTTSHTHTTVDNGAHIHTVGTDTVNKVDVVDKDHTHTVTGTIISSLSNGSTSEAGAHTHTVTGTITSSLSNSSTSEAGAHTHTVGADTVNKVDVASQDHTHVTTVKN